MSKYKNYLSAVPLMSLLGAAAAGAFYLPDWAAFFVSLGLLSGIVGYLATSENRFIAARQLTYNACYFGAFAVTASWGWSSNADFNQDLIEKSALAGIFILESLTVIYLLKRFAKLSPSATFCLGYFIIDNVNNFFFIPLSPSLLIIPYANTIMHWGGMPLAILVFYLIIFGIANIFLIKIVTTRRIIFSRIVVCGFFILCAMFLDAIKVEYNPKVDENRIFKEVKLLHLRNSIQPRDFITALKLIESMPKNSLIITPETFLHWDPAKFPADTIKKMTDGNKKLLIGVKKFINAEKYYALAYYMHDGEIGFKHRKIQLFPSEERLGALKQNKKVPEIHKISEGITVMPLICFDLILPLRNYKYPLPDFYAVMSNMENFNPVAPADSKIISPSCIRPPHITARCS